MEDKGILTLMYHRFDESKYPSTNIQMEILEKQIEIINNKNYELYDPKNFDIYFNNPKKNKKVLITIDDAFNSFYKNAWPFFKKNKIPFILFVSTNTVGKNGYMSWSEIIEIEKEDFVFIGNHSHTHEYLINFSQNDFENDINESIEIFKKNLGYNPIYFSYPFGEYSLIQKKYIASKFKYAFGQHSGVIDINKDKFELPRFPINEKYGDLKRFNSVIDMLPLQYKEIYPIDKLLTTSNNPPKMKVLFFKEQDNINKIKCFSNEGKDWHETNIKFEENKMQVFFSEKFSFRRGRINCSLNDNDGWRWLGIQFTIKDN